MTEREPQGGDAGLKVVGEALDHRRQLPPEMRERPIDDRWIALKPRWAEYRNRPVSFAMVWQKGAAIGD